MRIPFQVGGVPAEYVRNYVTGRAEVLVGDELYSVQSPFKLSTHITLRRRHVWRRAVHGHDVQIVKARHRIFGGFGPTTVTIRVNDEVVAEVTGE